MNYIVLEYAIDMRRLDNVISLWTQYIVMKRIENMIYMLVFNYATMKVMFEKVMFRGRKRGKLINF